MSWGLMAYLKAQNLERHLSELSLQVCGVRWNANLSSPVLERLGYNAGKMPGADFNTIFPYAAMKLCNVADDGVIRAFIGDPGFARDGSNGEVMLFIPRFYYRHTYDPGTKIHEYWVAPLSINGFKVHPAFIRAGVEKPYLLLGAYKAGTDANSKITSRTGTVPTVSITRATFRQRALNRGSKWLIEDVLIRSAIGLLLIVEYATMDTQIAIGNGITALPYSSSHTVTEEATGANTITVSPSTGTQFRVGEIIGVGTSLGGQQVAANREILSIDTSDPTKTVITVDGDPFNTAVGNIIYCTGQRTGQCDSFNGASGMATGTNSRVSVSYRGLEDLWGNVWEFIDGVNIRNAERQPYFADGSFVDNVFDGSYAASGVILPEGSGYVRNLCYSQISDWLLMPSEVGGGSTTYVPDYFYQNWAASSEKIALAGGGWFNGASAGFFCWYVSTSSGIASVNIGSRALLMP